MNINKLTMIMMEQIERLNKPNCDIEKEVQRSDAMAKVAGQIIKTGELAVKAAEVTGNNQLLQEQLQIGVK